MKRILVAGVLFLTFSSAHAFNVILDGSGTNALGITGLEIAPGSGELWDITFENVTEHDGMPPDCGYIFAFDPCPTPLQDQAGAMLAVTQIQLALNEDVSSGGNGNPVALTVGLTVRNGYHVPTLFESTDCNDPGQATGTCTAFGKFFSSSWAPALSAEILIDSNVEIAKFTPHVLVTPLPPAVWLFGSALGMLGWVRRRTNTKQRVTLEV